MVKVIVLIVCLAIVATAVDGRLERAAFKHPQWHREERPSGEQSLSFVVALRLPDDGRALREAFLRVSDPQHGDYGRYLDVDEVRQRFAPAAGVAAGVADWLRAAVDGAAVETSRSGDMLRVTASVAAVERGLATQLHWHRQAAGGRRLLRAAAPLRVPDEVADALAFTSLNAPPTTLPPEARRRRLRREPLEQHVDVGTASVLRGNEQAVVGFHAVCADGDGNRDSPPCPGDEHALTLFVDVSEHANDRRDPRPLLTDPLSFELPFARLTCLDTNSSLPCADTPPERCLCFAKLAPLPKYAQLRARLSVLADRSAAVVATAATHLFALTDVATATFLADMYDMPRGLRVPAGSNASQAVAEFYGEFYSNADLAEFMRLSGLPPAAIPAHDVVGNLPNDQSQPGGEAQLDVEYIMALAPGARTVFYSIADRNPYESENEGFLTYLYIVGNQTNPPLVHSLSYGDVEAVVFNASIPGAVQYAQRCDQEFMKMGLRGMTVLFSAGDDGSGSFLIRSDRDAACSRAWPEWPASSPYVTSVGATQLSRQYSPLCERQYSTALPDSLALDVQCSGTAETVCSSTLGGVITTGGGFSDVYDRTDVPWQEQYVRQYFERAADTLPPAGFFNRNGRGYPDVTAYGTNYFVYLDDRIVRESGTSASAPVFAAMVTQWNALRLANGQPPLGFIAPALYKLWAEHPETFNDITTGDIACGVGYSIETVPCCDHSFSATSGWDPTSGLGSPNFRNIASLLVVPAAAVNNHSSVQPSSGGNGSVTVSVIAMLVALACAAVTGYFLYHMRRAQRQSYEVLSRSAEVEDAA